MREIYRNPMLYYLVIPVLVGFWPLLVWGVYLPEVERAQGIERGLCEEGQMYVVDILRIDPGRLDFADATEVTAEFSYGPAVDRVANLCRIPASKCNYQAGNIITASGGKRRQDAKVKLANVSIVDAAKFLSTIQSMWVNLTCEKVKLSRKKGMPDQWEVDLSFLYYY
jgi:hypothetical protein